VIPRLTALALLLAPLLAGCGSSPGAVRTDLEAYLARSATWAPDEAESARTIERILRTQFVDEGEVHRQIADDRPRVVAHLQRVEAYQPRTMAVSSVHARYIQAWRDLLAAYDAVEAGFASGDYTKLAQGREGMARWREGLLSVAAELREMRRRFAPDTGGVTES
jgi:hypothetical protein